MNPHHEQILALPHASHPRLAAAARNLAGHPRVTVAEAARILDAAAEGARITGLDLEMCQPDANTAVPFAPVRDSTPEGEFHADVSRHVLRMINGGKN